MELTQEMVRKLSSQDITHLEYKDIMQKINKKVNEIWQFIIQVSNRKLYWWAFQNESSVHSNNGGEFDPIEDAEFITLVGSFSILDDYDYNEGFPTSFLWEDYKPIVVANLEELKKKKEKQKQEKQENRNQRQEDKKHLVASIKAKLTPEEFAIIKFK